MSDPKVVLFGASGYTGHLTARALVAEGVRPLLVARSSLTKLAAELGGLPTAAADVRRPESLRELLNPGDVLITTVGPFSELGEVAVEAAVTSGAHYLDSNGEPPFVHRVFDHWGPRAERAGVALFPAMGYEYLPGNIAGALALRDAGERGDSVRVGYFVDGAATPKYLSAGTRTSLIGALIAPSHAWRSGRIVREPGGRRVASFALPPTGSRRRIGLSVGGSEHFTLPRLSPGLRDVDVMLGWFGPATRLMQVLSYPGQILAAIPGFTRAATYVAGTRIVRGGRGPSEQLQERSTTLVVAEVRDTAGRVVGRAVCRGGSPYPFTGSMLAFGAQRALNGDALGSGALGPVDGLGLDVIEKAAGVAGLTRIE